jgi:hypothetical protein
MRLLIGGILIILGILIFLIGDVYLLITSIMDIINNGTTNLLWDVIKIIFREFIAGVFGFIFVFVGIMITGKD